MCGIFGIISNEKISKNDLRIIAKHTQQRGKDSSGIIHYYNDSYNVSRADHSLIKLINKTNLENSNIILGHSRLITNSHLENQPVLKDEILVLHNGIIVNCDQIWNQLKSNRSGTIDTEVIGGIASDHINNGEDINLLSSKIEKLCRGVVSIAVVMPKLGKMLLFSNNGSLYVGKKNNSIFFASEEYPLKEVKCSDIQQILNDHRLIDIPFVNKLKEVHEIVNKRLDLVPKLKLSSSGEKLLEYHEHKLKRCSKCILPETMPYIFFDDNGVCNYCNNYKLRNVPKDKEILFDLVDRYRRKNGNDCIVPFSGGRDSCYSLHLISKELKLKPVAYTYDWGMVTDLGRRNISRMCAKLGVENIIFADDISKKRKNIKMNVIAWLKNPNLGMVSIFTAGDKHFFRHVETVKNQTNISLNLWGVNPLEVTHFKAGFLGIPPDFEEKKVYSSGGMKQLRYQLLRLKEMLKSPLYLNSSLWDTVSGEYWRSYHRKIDYFHVFDYWRWDEHIIDDCLLNEYSWEKAPDTNTTWRIGDGTAAFYNYIYYNVAGFTEHDTFRSNQIREGDLTREKALELVKDENSPRYPNLQWYLDSIGLDFEETIRRINKIPKMYQF